MLDRQSFKGTVVNCHLCIEGHLKLCFQFLITHHFKNIVKNKFLLRNIWKILSKTSSSHAIFGKYFQKQVLITQYFGKYCQKQVLITQYFGKYCQKQVLIKQYFGKYCQKHSSYYAIFWKILLWDIYNKYVNQ